MQRLAAFDHRGMRSIARVWWQQHVSNYEVRQRVLGKADENELANVIDRQRLRWLGHVLRMSNRRLPCRALFSEPAAD